MTALYTVLPSPGEGLGCFSTILIPAGTLILTEKPLFAVREPRNNSSVIAAFSQLPSFQQEQYLVLHALDAKSRGPTLVVDIFNSNAWQTGSRTSILLLAARFNHSCVPNASFSWDARLDRITVHAIVAIPSNTQIYLSYERPYQTLSSRRTKLCAYGFICSCIACGSGAEASEIRRARMVVLDARIRVARRQKLKAALPRAALELIKLVKEEGLVGEALGLAYHDAAAGWRRYGRLDLAMIYALRELDVGVMCYGADSVNVDITRAFLQKLESQLADLAQPPPTAPKPNTPCQW